MEELCEAQDVSVTFEGVFRVFVLISMYVPHSMSTYLVCTKNHEPENGMQRDDGQWKQSLGNH